MNRIFGAKKDKEPFSSIQDASDRIYFNGVDKFCYSITGTIKTWINKKGDIVDEKIKKLNVELVRYKEQIKKTRPGSVQEGVKARAMRVLKQKRTYEGQRDILYNQSYNLDQLSFAAESIKDAQHTNLEEANVPATSMKKNSWVVGLISGNKLGC